LPGLLARAPVINELTRVAVPQQSPLVQHRMDSRVDSGLLSPAQLLAWQEAARNFELNTDFDISTELDGQIIPLTKLMHIMKEQSHGKRTIQAIGDKILLNRLLNNLGVPQMPVLYASHGVVHAGEIERLVDNLENSGEDDAFDIVAKPTHLSNCTGTLILTTDIWESEEYTAETLVDHMRTYLPEKAHETESAALQSLMPGFIVQPCYKSCIDWSFPIEIRVITLWGKTRLGVWWWGSKDSGDAEIRWERNAWIVQDSCRGERWNIIHDNPTRTAEYDQSLQLIRQAMPEMAKIAERIATAIGTPFLRSDFFVGSSKWGLRLNEVAYGSNIEMRRRLAPGLSGYADDSAAIAQNLQEGYKHCRKQPPSHFLSRLGAEGTSYEPEWWKFWSCKPGLQIYQLPSAACDAPVRKDSARRRLIC